MLPSSPITSWQIDGEIMEIVSDFIFLAGPPRPPAPDGAPAAESRTPSTRDSGQRDSITSFLLCSLAHPIRLQVALGTGRQHVEMVNALDKGRGRSSEFSWLCCNCV